MFLSAQPNRFLAKRERKALANSYAAIVSSIYWALKDHRQSLWKMYEAMERVDHEYRMSDLDRLNKTDNENAPRNYDMEKQNIDIETDFGKRAARIRSNELPELNHYLDILGKSSDKFGKMNSRATYILTELYVDIVKGTLQHQYEHFTKNLDDIEKSEGAHIFQVKKLLETYTSYVDTICRLCINTSKDLGNKSLTKNRERYSEERYRTIRRIRKQHDKEIEAKNQSAAAKSKRTPL